MTNKVTDKILFDKFVSIENSQRIYLDPDKPLVIRLDGKNMTKDHKEYKLIPCEDWRDPIIDATIGTILHFANTAKAGGTVECFWAMDEVNVIYNPGETFLRCFDDTNMLYAAAMFLQGFVKRLKAERNEAPDFGISTFTIDIGDIEDYVLLREQLTYHVATDYIIKEYGIRDRSEAEKKVFEVERQNPGFATGTRFEMTVTSKEPFIEW